MIFALIAYMWEISVIIISFGREPWILLFFLPYSNWYGTITNLILMGGEKMMRLSRKIDIEPRIVTYDSSV